MIIVTRPEEPPCKLLKSFSLHQVINDEALFGIHLSEPEPEQTTTNSYTNRIVRTYQNRPILSRIDYLIINKQILDILIQIFNSSQVIRKYCLLLELACLRIRFSQIFGKVQTLVQDLVILTRLSAICQIARQIRLILFCSKLHDPGQSQMGFLLLQRSRERPRYADHRVKTAKSRSISCEDQFHCRVYCRGTWPVSFFLFLVFPSPSSISFFSPSPFSYTVSSTFSSRSEHKLETRQDQ